MTFTSLEDEDALIATLVATGRVAVTELGDSVQGRPLRVLRIGDPPPELTKLTPLFLLGCQHGNEPAGREGALEFAEYLATTVDTAEVAFLAEHGVLIMPTANPDGFANGIRQNANGVDINRGHLSLAQAENVAVATVMASARPLIAVDLHEAFPQSTRNITFAPPRLDATESQIRSEAEQLIEVMKARADLEGWTHGNYGDAAADGDERVFVANSGIRHTVGVLIETSRNDDTELGQTERTAWQYAMCEEAFTYARLNVAHLDGVRGGAVTASVAAGAAGDPIDIRSTTLDPAPLAYELSEDQLPQAAQHLQLYNIGVSGGVMSMAQSSRVPIAFIFDPAAEFTVIEAQPVFDPPPPPGISTDFLPSGTPQPVVHWIACELVTGRKIATLRDLSGGFGRLLGAYTTSSHELPIPSMGGQDLALSERAELAVQATTPYRTMLVAVINDQPTYGGIVTKRAGGTGAALTLACVSIEGYLARRFVQDHAWENQDDISVIAAGLLGDAGPILGVGTGIGLEIDAPASGRMRTREYSRRDRSSVYDRMQELMGVQNGPEWTVELLWGDDTHTWVRKVVRVRPRIGVASANPTAIFSTTGEANVEYVLDEDYSEGKGANYIQAYSVGEGDDQPESDPAIAHDLLAQGWPIVEHHWQPSSTIKRQSTLNLHAQRELQLQQYGALVWSLTGRWDASPHLNVNWRLGDDIAWRVTGPRHPQRDDGQPGAIGKGRCIGWNLDPEAGTVTPLLLDPTSGG